MELEKFKYKINNVSIPFYYKKTSSDTPTYYAKILKGELYKKINFKKKVDIILDLGANFGAASICFAIRHPNSTIISFEPVFETYKILDLNTKNFKSIFTYNIAASDQDGTADIYIDKNKLGRSSLFSNHMNFNYNFSEKINIVNFYSFLRNNNIEKIDILKIDVEGSELKIINNIKSFLKNISVIYIEIHGKKRITEVNKILSLTHKEITRDTHNNDLVESVFINYDLI